MEENLVLYKAKFFEIAVAIAKNFNINEVLRSRKDLENLFQHSEPFTDGMAKLNFTHIIHQDAAEQV